MKKLFLALLLQVVLLPLSMVVTVLIHPFWRFVETQTGIEAYGHFGPAEWCYWVDYFLLAAPSLWLVLRRRVSPEAMADSPN